MFLSVVDKVKFVVLLFTGMVCWTKNVTFRKTNVFIQLELLNQP